VALAFVKRPVTEFNAETEKPVGAGKKQSHVKGRVDTLSAPNFTSLMLLLIGP